MILPLKPTPQATMQAAEQAERIEKILAFCAVPRTREEIQEFINIVNRDYFRKDILKPLLDAGLLLPTLPDKLISPNQRYYAFKQKESLLDEVEA